MAIPFILSFVRSRLGLISLGLLAPFFWVLSAQAQTPDEMRAWAQSRLPVMALINQGTALVNSPTARRALEEQEGLRAFGGMAGGRQEFSKSGHAKVDGFSFLAGLGRRSTIDDSPLAAFTYGIFGEGGTGSIETRRDYQTGEGRSEGRGHYVGGGFLLKAEFQNRLYLDGAFRVGQAGHSLDALEVRGEALDRPDSSSVYFGAAGSLGWLTEVSDGIDLDLYGRLLWSQLVAGEKRSVGADLVEVAKLNSTRLVLGTRADFRVGEGRLVYAGAAWEHEFNGRPDLAVNGRHFRDNDGLEGDSLVGEVGLELVSAEGFSAGFGLEGAWGRREALGGLLRLGYVF